MGSKKAGKLSLNKESIRLLSGEQLANAGGAWALSLGNWVCAVVGEKENVDENDQIRKDTEMIINVTDATIAITEHIVSNQLGGISCLIT